MTVSQAIRARHASAAGGDRNASPATIPVSAPLLPTGGASVTSDGALAQTIQQRGDYLSERSSLVGRQKRGSMTAEVWRHIVRYDPDTGALTWKPRWPELFDHYLGDSVEICARWNDENVDKPAFDRLNCGGYKEGSFHRVRYLAHRVAFAIVHGEWPSLIDHINQDRTDNRIVNLRVADRGMNARNRSVRVHDHTGKVLGVLCKPNGWMVVVPIGGNNVSVGTYSTEAEAIAARTAAAICLNELRKRSLIEDLKATDAEVASIWGAHNLNVGG